MAVQVQFKDYSAEVIERLGGNVKKALTAWGTEAVGMITDQMESGYGKPIRFSGELMGDVNFKVDGEKSVTVGNSLKYAQWVHEGHSGHAHFFEDIQEFRIVPGGHTPGRPYIRDALNEGADRLKQVVEENLKKGF